MCHERIDIGNSSYKFLLLTGLGLLAMRTLPQIFGRQTVSDSLLQYQTQLPTNVNGVIVTKQGSCVKPDIKEMAMQSLNPFGILSLAEFTKNSGTIVDSIKGHLGGILNMKPKIVKSDIVQKVFKAKSPGI